MILLALACNREEAPARWHLVAEDRYLATTAVGGAWVATEAGLFLEGERFDDELPEGPVTFIEGSLAHVWGKGLFTLDGEPADEGLDNDLLALLNPDAVPVALDLAEGEQIWLAAAGGLFVRRPGAVWEGVDLSSSGDLNLLFSSVDADGEHVVATAMLPSSIIPNEYSNVLSGTLFESWDDGESWASLSLGSEVPTSVAIGETLYVGTLDAGVLVGGEQGFTSLGGPSDVVDLELLESGALLVGSASRGAWLWDGVAWSQSGDAPIVGVGEGWAVDIDGVVHSPKRGAGDPPPKAAGGQVHVALSFHGNLYHSYRGDSPTDDGYGLDIDVIRNSLDWLAEHPRVHADWDFDNAWSTDLWLPQDAPDILEDIAARVEAGQDDVRLMSWNNGAMVAMTREEFAEAVARGRDSNEAAFGEMVDGVQPQECMFGPDHIEWYPDEGIEWVTLFNAANGFTALRSDHDLRGRAAFGPITLTAGGAEMTAVPVYHHADVFDHGGLAGWVRQLSAQHAEDTLLVVHFDADGETWENFDRELEAVAELDFVTYTKIADYLATHDPVATVELVGDVADGTGDGFQSWAEKSFNHEMWTAVVQSRDLCAAASLLGAEDCDLEQRLLAMSTTNYGLAAPVLHQDRIASATAYAEGALAEAEAALAAVDGPAEGEIQVVNTRDAAGPALISVELPTEADVLLRHEGVDLAYARSGSFVEFVLEVEAESVTTVAWLEADPLDVEAPDEPRLVALEAPFTECAGDADKGSAIPDEVISEGPRTSVIDAWDLELCEATGTVTRTLSAHAGLPGVIVDVHAELGGDEVIEDLESVALSPLSCRGASELSWPSMSGATWTRPVRSPVETWNGQAADGWVELSCDGGPLVIVHRTTDRTSMAFAPMRVEDGDALIAPLGTLWGDGPWHDARRTGGHGIGDLVVPVVGSQYRPAAPDWGDEVIDYRLLVGDDIDPDVRELFAHPPLARAR